MNKNNSVPRTENESGFFISELGFDMNKIPIFWGSDQYIGIDDMYQPPTTWRNNEPLRIPKVVRFLYEAYTYDESKELPNQGGGGDSGGPDDNGTGPPQCNATVSQIGFTYAHPESGAPCPTLNNPNPTYDAFNPLCYSEHVVYYAEELFTPNPVCGPVTPFPPQAVDGRPAFNTKKANAIILYGFNIYVQIGSFSDPQNFNVPEAPLCGGVTHVVNQITDVYATINGKIWQCKNKKCISFQFTTPLRRHLEVINNVIWNIAEDNPLFNEVIG